MQRSLSALFVSAAVAASLAACSSVKLNDKDAAANAAGAQDGQSSVAAVDASNASATQAGPQDVARTVYFDFDSYVVRPDARPTVEGNAQWLKQHRTAKVKLEGHTDEVGGREYNLALGQKRAEAVRRSMTVLGVPDTQMEAISFGKERPAVPGGGENERNRRVEFNYR